METVGNFDWQLQVDQSGININSDNTDITEVYITHVDFMDKFKEHGTPYEPKNSFEERFNNLYVLKISLQNIAKDIYRVTYNYGDEAALNNQTTKQDGESEYTLDTATMERPLEANKNFVCCWTNNVYKALDVTKEIDPNFDDVTFPYDEMKNLTDLKFPYTFAKEKPADITVENVVYSYHLIRDKSKKEAESFIIPTDVVTETTYFKNEKSANRASETTAKMLAPAKTFGKSKSDDHWLVMGASVSYDKEQRKHVVNRTFQYGEIDTDIYDKVGD